MTAALYTRYEVLRAFRSTRFFAFSLGFPLVMFYLFAGPNRDVEVEGVPFTLYLMGGMTAWGSMIAVMSCGARIAGERAVNWNRQLRITPLPVRSYFRAKILTGYALAAMTMLALDAAGTSMGVRLTALQWMRMTGLVLIGLAPFAVLGVLLGHLLTVDSLGPAMGGISALFGIFGGAWGPIFADGVLHDLSMMLPSYWLVQAGRSALTGTGWPAQGWLVIAVWTAALIPLAATVYRRDTARN
jgi:ABC-2 type transport system permease protein